MRLVVLMMLAVWVVLSVPALPLAVALGRAARLQDRADRRAARFLTEPASFRIPVWSARPPVRAMGFAPPSS